MARVYDKAYFNSEIVPIQDAKISIASSAVLYGLSVYTVFPVSVTKKGLAAFRLPEHYKRLRDSARIIGMDTFNLSYEELLGAVRALIKENSINENVLVRASVHVSAELPGTRSRGLSTVFSMFAYEAIPILPQDGARLKTSVWRRVPDFSIPSRAKVNGAYVNSVLARQDAIDSGYDDCIFLDFTGHVCELSASNIFIVRDGKLITPHTASDILEGITRRTVLELARADGMQVHERSVDLTELYVADEVFATGTSTGVASIIEIDGRVVNGKAIGPITQGLRDRLTRIFAGEEPGYEHLLTQMA